MGAMRAQGRPRRGAAEVGRDRIITNLQGAVRLGVDLGLSRKTLSEHAGVTPALISYYFPKKEVLLQEIAEPIIQSYRFEVQAILARDSGKDDKLRSLICVLVSLYTRDGQTLDIYNDVMQRAAVPQENEISKINSLLGDFFSSWNGCEVDNRFDATVLQGAIWGMCRFAARADAEGLDLSEDISPLVSRVARIVSASLSTSLNL